MKKRILSLLLAVCLMVGLLPMAALAEGNVQYLNGNSRIAEPVIKLIKVFNGVTTLSESNALAADTEFSLYTQLLADGSDVDPTSAVSGMEAVRPVWSAANRLELTFTGANICTNSVYFIKETATNSNYILSDRIIRCAVQNDGTVIYSDAKNASDFGTTEIPKFINNKKDTITIINEYHRIGNIIDHSEIASGTTFGIFDTPACDNTVIATANAIIVPGIGNDRAQVVFGTSTLTDDEYYIKEIAVGSDNPSNPIPAHYAVSDVVIKVKLESGKVYYWDNSAGEYTTEPPVVVNTKLYDISIKKSYGIAVTPDLIANLSTAEYSLYDGAGTLIDTKNVVYDGGFEVTFTELVSGYYYIKENVAPSGFKKSDKVIGVHIAPMGEVTYKENSSIDDTDFSAATTAIPTVLNKKMVAVPTADSTEYIYNGKAQTYGVVSTADYTVTGGTQTDVGSYPITITLTNDNFEWDGELGTYTFVIKKAPVKITANSFTIKVGEALPTFEYKAVGLVNNETLPITVNVSCTAADSSTEGTYQITVSGASESTNYSFTYVNGTLTVEKKSSGSTSGGGGGSSGHTSTTKPKNPSIGGSEKSWSDIAADLAKLTTGSEATIRLNGFKTVTVEVIKAIADTDCKVKFVINSSFTWIVDGSKITTPAEADLTFTKTTSTKSESFRGIEGTQFCINDTGIPTSLEIAFKTEHAGKFANLYKNVDGKPVFVTCVKLGADGKVILPDIAEKGDYVVMLCEFSDLSGDMDNDGILNAKDSLAILKDFIGLEKGVNPLVSDMNGDGYINAKDALIILKKFVGIE